MITYDITRVIFFEGSLEPSPFALSSWFGFPEIWCKRGIIEGAVVGVTGGQATCCQRLLAVVTENLAMLQRWDKKGF